MKKRIAFLACAVIFLLGGCQMENVSQKDGTDTDSIMEDYNFQAGIPPDTENERKDSESVCNETNKNQESGNDSEKVEMDSRQDGTNIQEEDSDREDEDGKQEDTNIQIGDSDKEGENLWENSPDEETLPQKAFVEEIAVEEIQKQELEREGKFRGQLAPGHNVPLGRINSGIKMSITFYMVCEQENAECKIILTDVETGEAFENTITETGTAFFEMNAGNIYSIAIENQSSFDVDFILDYFMEEF